MTRPRYSLPRRQRRLRRYLERKLQKGGRKFPWIHMRVSEHVSVFVLRSNLFKTISLSSALQVSRQSATMPLTLQVRGGVDGKNNFGLYRRSHNPAERQYSPFIQVVTTRTFKDRISFTA